ncbi:SRPBCC family protein [Promicromonospora sp. MS192]|uniref:SRPBCC family protein n=1 Tax=Promicromonospora sp. MS192 TaxID=3412684 RepID=UPI003C2CA185
MPSYHVGTTTSAAPGTVWRLLIDGRSWPRWSSGLDELVETRSSGLDPEGRDGVGAVRAFRTGRTVAAERLVELVENRSMTYEDVVNPALRDYRAEIQLEPNADGGTAISWRGSWRARPGVGWLMPFILPGVMQRMADDLSAYAAQVDREESR